MADNLTDALENAALDWINAVGTPARPTAPLRARLMTANGTDATAGTEVATGGGYTAGAGVNVTFTAAAGGASSNNAAVEFKNMPRAETIVGLEVWDSAVTPVRVWYGALMASKTVNAGDTFTIPLGDLDTTLG
jgi:hypothetical protein